MKMADTNLAAWVAIAVTTGGGLLTTAIHYGSTNTQIAAIEQKQEEANHRLSDHDRQLLEIQKSQAAAVQKLQDIADTVHDMRDNGVKRK